MFRFSAKPPLCASVVRVHVTVLVPEAPNSQHVGVLPDALSSDGFCNRLLLVTVTVTEFEVVALPARSTARAVTVWLPSGTVAEFHANVYGAEFTVPTTFPSTRKLT